MKRLPRYTVLLIIFLFASAFAELHTENDESNASMSWTLDEAHTTIQFTVKHFFTPVTGRFDNYQTNILFDPDDLENSSIDVTIPVSSINTQNEQRDNHLKSDDFFNTAEWPNIRFTSSDIRSKGGNEFVAVGDLTIRDVTRQIELPFTLLGVMDHPMKENVKVAGITSETTINKSDFGVGVGDWAATMVVGDEVDINLNLELNSQ